MLPRADIYEARGHLVVESDLPGVIEEDVVLRVTKEKLRIEFRLRAPAIRERPAYFRKERIPGEFCRELRLPRRVDPDSLEARLDHGTLQVRLRLDDDAAGERAFGVETGDWDGPAKVH
jgi:HSP20 family protein